MPEPPTIFVVHDDLDGETQPKLEKWGTLRLCCYSWEKAETAVQELSLIVRDFQSSKASDYLYLGSQRIEDNFIDPVTSALALIVWFTLHKKCQLLLHQQGGFVALSLTKESIISLIEKEHDRRAKREEAEGLVRRSGRGASY